MKRRTRTIADSSDKRRPGPIKSGKGMSPRFKATANTRPSAIVVLGMHRSGTSAITRVINLLGADLPGLLMPPTAANKTGYWESTKLLPIHDEILYSAGSKWDDWRAFNQDWYKSPCVDAYKARILEVLRTDFSESRLFIVKDPRICRFWPLWSDILAEFGADPKIVLSIRHPLEVASSLKHREGFLPAQSLLLWLRHVLDAESSTRNLPRAIVSYDGLMHDWSAVVAAMGSRLQISWPKKSAVTEINIERFLSQEFHHHTNTLQELSAKKEIVDWLKDSYAALRHLSLQPERKEHLASLDRVRSEFDKAAAAFGVALAAQEMKLSEREAETAKLQEQLAASNERLRHTKEAEAAAADLKQELEQSRTAAAHETKKLTSDLAALRRRITDLLDENRRQHAEADEAVSKANEALDASYSLLSMERQRSAEAADRIVELEEHLSVSRQTLAAMADEATELRAQLDDHVRNRAEQSDAIDTLADDLSHANKTLFELTSALRLKETEAARDHQTLSDDLSRANTTLFELTSALRLKETDSARDHQTLSDDLLQANKTLFELTSALRLKEAAAARDHQELQDLRTQRSTLNSIVDDNTWRLNRLQNELNGVKSTFFWRLAAPFRSFQRRVQLTNEYKLISRSGLFDPAWYLDKYPDVKTTNIDPLFHYLRYGANEGRRPSPLFDTTVYLQRNPDIKAAGLNPLVHYLRYGLKEARPLSAKDETL
jgi:hypothetical protein